MNLIQRIVFNCFGLPKISLEEVFTPAKAAEINYVERADIDKLLASEMSTPGKQIIVFGHSGSGKTSSVRNLLRKNKYKFIKTHCESNTTFEQLLKNAFDELNVYVVSGKAHKRTGTIKGDAATDYYSIKANLGVVKSSEDSETYSRLLPPQLTPQKLAEFMGKGEIVWLIEDFHKVSPDEKKRIADVIKIFVDNANDYSVSKIICIGACQSAHELIKLDPNLRTRVSEVAVPLLTDEEIKRIIINGFNLLNVVPSQSLVEKLVYYSDKLGSSAHQMCMDICKEKGIKKRSSQKINIDDEVFQYAVNGFINRSTDTFKSIYEAAVKNELGWYILRTFSGNVMGKLSLDEICKNVNKSKMSFGREEIETKLKELMSPDFNIIYHDNNSEKYAISNPFWHRFLRIQLAIERSEQQYKKSNKRNPNLKLIDTNIKYRTVDEAMIEVIKKLEEIRRIDA